MPLWALLFAVFRDPLDFASPAVGVGTPRKHPRTLSAMRGTTVGRGQHLPLRIEPEVGQSAEDTVEPGADKPSAVFHEHVPGSHFADHAEHFVPEPRARPFEAGARSGTADVLAGEPPADDIDFSLPLTAIERPHVIENRKLAEHVLPSAQHAPAERFDLDGRDSPMAEQVPRQDAAADASKQVEFAHYSMPHSPLDGRTQIDTSTSSGP